MSRLTVLLAFAVLTAHAAPAGAQEWTRRLPLPVPTGPLAVGRVILHLVDSTRPASHHLSYRPLTIRLWYPALAASGPRARYIEQPALLDSMIAHQYLELTPETITAFGSAVLSAGEEFAPARSPGADGWPVLVFAPGMGVSSANYGSLCQELASHGYVVVEIEHPIGGFGLAPDGRLLAPGSDSLPYTYPRVLPPLLRDYSRDAGLVIRTLAGRTDLLPSGTLLLDTTRVGNLGHSIGGAAALQACRDDALFVACADMDGDTFGDVATGGVGKPFLVLLSEPAHRAPPTDSAGISHRRMMETMGRERDSSWLATMERQPGVPGYIVKLEGTGHFTFSDAPFLFPAQMQGTGSTVEPGLAFRRVTTRLLDFFDHYLKREELRLLRPGLGEVDR